MSAVAGVQKALDEVTDEDQELMTTDEYQVCPCTGLAKPTDDTSGILRSDGRRMKRQHDQYQTYITSIKHT